jgi:hypothetical protein
MRPSGHLENGFKTTDTSGLPYEYRPSSTSLSMAMEPSMFQGCMGPLSSDHHFIVMHNMTTTAAFVSIGHALELPCMQDTGFYLSTLTSPLPPALIATLQQQVVPHRPYVDMLPWSTMRDRILNSLAAINDQEFIKDMLTSDVKVWGSTPWEPTGVMSLFLSPPPQLPSLNVSQGIRSLY